MVPRRVALLIEAVSAYGRGVLAGIAEYGRAHGPWAFALNMGGPWDICDMLHDCGVGGVIASVQSAEQAAQLGQLGLPFVNVSRVLVDAPMPLVTYDDPAIGRMAADHLLEAGLRHFGFVGYAGDHSCELRSRGFERRLDAHSFDPQTFALARDKQICDQVRRLGHWLNTLAKPAGIFACNDQVGRYVLEAARFAHLDVPEQLAVLGVDDDPLTNDLAHPRLSSVKVPAGSVGYKAAELLDRVMAGAPAPQAPMLLPPIIVAARPSSSMLSISDPEVIKAVRFIRDNAGQPLQVTDILESVALSRRSLERRFRQHLGRSPQQEIQRVRIERARALLAETDIPVNEVADATGFRNPDRMTAVFRKSTGLTPTHYRAQYRRR
jgi:LacI family transcriptional regulator